MRNIETFPSKQMYPYLSLDERKVAEFYHNIDRRRWLVWLKWLIFINFSGQLMVSLTWLCIFTQHPSCLFFSCSTSSKYPIILGSFSLEQTLSKLLIHLNWHVFSRDSMLFLGNASFWMLNILLLRFLTKPCMFYTIKWRRWEICRYFLTPPLHC